MIRGTTGWSAKKKSPATETGVPICRSVATFLHPLLHQICHVQFLPKQLREIDEYLIRFESYCKTQEQREEEHNGITCTMFVVIHKEILLSIE